MQRIAMRVLTLAALGLGAVGAAHAGGASTTAAPPARAVAAATDPAPPLFWHKPLLPTRFISERIGALAFDPATPGLALAGVNSPGDVLLRSTDGGLTWQALPGWNPDDQRFGYHVSYGGQAGVFYAWGGIAVYKTADGGDTWTKLPYNTGCNQILTLKVHPAQPDLLLLGTSHGLVRSPDGGQTWPGDLCMSGPLALSIDAGVDQPNVVYANPYASDVNSLWRSDDHGQTWRNVGDPGVGFIRKVVVDPRDADVVYTQSELGTIYKSTTGGGSNGGGQWVALTQGVENVKLGSLTYDAQTHTLYAASESRVYTLADGAQTWQPVFSDLIPQPSSVPQAPRVVLVPGDSSRLILHNDNGIYTGLPAKGRVSIPFLIRD